MPETTANDANYEEIRGHLDIIKAKLAKPADPDTRAALSGDLEDYYERALQLRIMQNQTQREELAEQTARVTWLLWCARRGGALFAAVVVATAALAAEYTQPGFLATAAANPTAVSVGSHAAVAAAVVAVMLCARP